MDVSVNILVEFMNFIILDIQHCLQNILLYYIIRINSKMFLHKFLEIYFYVGPSVHIHGVESVIFFQKHRLHLANIINFLNSIVNWNIFLNSVIFYF